VNVVEVKPGLWRWELPHPEWTPSEGADDGWDREVACYALAGPERLVLIDPLAPPEGTDEAARFWRALDRDVDRLGPPAILVTIHWHARSSSAIAARYPGAEVWAHAPARDLVEERTPVTTTFEVGDTLPGDIQAFATASPEVLFWIPGHAALVAGDVLLGGPSGVRLVPASWLPEGVTSGAMREAAARTIDLPVELLLLTHGPVLENAAAELRRVLVAE
jgi:glyoxylase-like metal-dependent hydrolase (beta-lactamase superfamily II)